MPDRAYLTPVWLVKAECARMGTDIIGTCIYAYPADVWIFASVFYVREAIVERGHKMCEISGGAHNLDAVRPLKQQDGLKPCSSANRTAFSRSSAYSSVL